jgi:hypothetical protein
MRPLLAQRSYHNRISTVNTFSRISVTPGAGPQKEKAIVPKNINPSTKLYRFLLILAEYHTSTDLLKIEKRCYTDLYRKRDPYPGKKLLLASTERKTTCILHTRLISRSLMKERSTMPRHPKLIQLSLVGTVLLGLLIGVYLVALRRFPKPDPSHTIIKHSVDTHPDEVLKYWTADRMRNAKPVDLPNVTALDREKQHPRRPAHTSGPEHS